ncbi:MAG TPA: helix-turn-helix domain-containing protein [Jiangellales bacterium]|nr:helix-turn-helix domain-containing protein [Jiangellales bacterium]
MHDSTVTAILGSERLAYSAKEAADLIGVTERHMRRLIADEVIRSVKRNGRRLIPRDELLAYIEVGERAA